MSPTIELPHPVLYQNEDRTITLIDLPQSISFAQGTPGNPCTDALYSSPPLKKPYASLEPRSEKAKQKVQHHILSGSLSQTSFPRELLVQGLAEIRAERSLTFCCQRRISPFVLTHQKENRSDSESSEDWDKRIPEPKMVTRSMARGFNYWMSKKHFILPSSALSNGYGTSQMVDIMNQVVINPFPQMTHIHISETGTSYRMPPLSTFMFAKVGQLEASRFSNAACKILSEPTTSTAPGQFDFILLDPPWDNKSVRRSETYQTRRNAEEDPLTVLQEMLGRHIAPGALVACWITNKQSVRATALEIFETWGIDLIEEWAWLKTTVHGEPVCDIDGTVRRPYEILLIGRSQDITSDGREDSDSDVSVRKRLVMGVPDLHSRKPCLKTLIEPMMRDKSNYRALEVFARHLTAGWWSWGDEVLKYNWEGYWTKAEVQ
ncbi:MAG: hypothetical protein Q9201_007402 [Fulgogasparrea decipioides]